jgi:hypothetical protein
MGLHCFMLICKIFSISSTYKHTTQYVSTVHTLHCLGAGRFPWLLAEGFNWTKKNLPNINAKCKSLILLLFFCLEYFSAVSTNGLIYSCPTPQPCVKLTALPLRGPMCMCLSADVYMAVQIYIFMEPCIMVRGFQSFGRTSYINFYI